MSFLNQSKCGIVPQLFYTLFREYLEKSGLRHGDAGYTFAFSEVVVLVGLYAEGTIDEAAKIAKYLGPFTFALSTIRSCLKRLAVDGVVVEEKRVRRLSEKFKNPVAEAVENACRTIGVRFDGIVWERSS